MRSEILVHARPAALISQKAKTFEGGVTIRHKGRCINAKSIMQLISSNIEKGDEIEIIANTNVVEELEKFFK